MANAPTPPTPATPNPATPRHRWLIIAGVIVIVLLALGLGFKALSGPSLPRLNDNAVVITKFIHAGEFYDLPFEQQRQFYKVMDDRDAELDDAYSSKRLSESEYRSGLEAAWLGKHINRVEKYFSLSPGQARTSYVAKLLEKKERKKAKNAKANSASSEEDIDADETAAELRVEKWPGAVKSQWDAFHNAYRSQKKAMEKASEPQSKPAA